MTLLLILAALLAALPCGLYLANLLRYRTPAHPQGPLPPLSILIPARDEERNIEPCVRAALASRGLELEVIVLDDHSRDDTRAIVARLAAGDPRVRLEAAPELPEGWCGKQHACWHLAARARHAHLLFVDADVRLAADGARRLLGFLLASDAALVSGIPRQRCGSLAERLVVPLIHWVLLGFLPLGRMRRSVHPAYGAGCGQLFLARRDAYESSGGHAAIRSSLHDGVALPRAFRLAGWPSDLCDATALASCRMFRGARELSAGLSRNAHEGLASPGMILPATLFLLGGQLLPFAALPLVLDDPLQTLLAATGIALALLPRLAGLLRFRQPLAGVLLHPLGALWLLLIQWWAFTGVRLGRKRRWRGREYVPGESMTSR